MGRISAFGDKADVRTFEAIHYFQNNTRKTKTTGSVQITSAMQQ